MCSHTSLATHGLENLGSVAPSAVIGHRICLVWDGIPKLYSLCHLPLANIGSVVIAGVQTAWWIVVVAQGDDRAVEAEVCFRNLAPP